MIRSVYLIGSLRNPEIPKFALELRQQLGIEVFDDWHAPGPNADDHWQEYERVRGRNYLEAINGRSASHIFEWDKSLLDLADASIMLMPAGKSGHLELGYTVGQGKPAYILFDKEPERYDIMYRFAAGIFFSKEALFKELARVNGRVSNG